MAIKVSGVKIGELEVSLEGAEGATLKQVLAAVGIAQTGQQFIINGDRKAPVTNAAGATVRDGDTVEVFDRPQAGVVISVRS
jgi:sulfur carrier protein ThiS